MSTKAGRKSTDVAVPVVKDEDEDEDYEWEDDEDEEARYEDIDDDDDEEEEEEEDDEEEEEWDQGEEDWDEPEMELLETLETLDEQMGEDTTGTTAVMHAEKAETKTTFLPSSGQLNCDVHTAGI
jgi:hypothetical protein